MFDENNTRRRRRRGEIPVRLVETASDDPAEDKEDKEAKLTGSAQLLLRLQLFHRHGYGDYVKKEKGE